MKTNKIRAWAGCVSRSARAGRRGAKRNKAVYTATCRRLQDGRGEERHFSEGVNFYKLVWLYVIGGFAGFIVETIWCYHVYHRIEWHSAMAFTPFNPIYGAGAVALFLCLRKVPKRNFLLVFFISAAAGTLVELVSSYIQEFAFHSYSWDYRHLPWNFEGRICLGMSVAWGLLGVAWAWLLCPAMERLIAALPQRTGKITAAVLAAVIAVDAAVTVAAMLRWLARRAGLSPRTAVGVFLDKFFPDARMHFLFPRIKFFP